MILNGHVAPTERASFMEGSSINMMLLRSKEHMSQVCDSRFNGLVRCTRPAELNAHLENR